MRKYILKKALAGWLPERILNLPKKGFGIPLNNWLRSMPDPKAQWGIDADHLATALEMHKSRRGDLRLFLWAVHVLNHLRYGKING